MITLPQRIKQALWAATIFTLITASHGPLLMLFVVFISSFIVWWLVFKTYKHQITTWSAFTIAIFPVIMLIHHILGFSIYNNLSSIVLGAILILAMPISFVISTSEAIRIFQTKPTAARIPLFDRVLKFVILMVGVGILLFKIEMYLYSMDGWGVATSVSPSGKLTFQIRKSCFLVCSNDTATIFLKKGTDKVYSESCIMRENFSQPTDSSHFRWNADETIVSWKSPNNSIGEIDLQKDCGNPVLPSSLDDGDPLKFVFVSPSRRKILFRKITCLVGPCKSIFALRVRESDSANWDNYHCNLHIPNGTQGHGGSMRTEDIPDNVAITPIIRWGKNETVIYSDFQSPRFLFDLKKVCNWK